MMFVGYTEHESDSVCMWDPSTMRVVVTRDVIWLKQLHFQTDDVTGVRELDTAEDCGDNGNTTVPNNLPLQAGDEVTWSDPIVTEPTRSGVTRSGQTIKTPERLTCAATVELRYLREMAELDQVEPTAVYLSIRCMEFALVGAGVGSGIKHTKELKVLNFKKAMRSPDADEWRKEIQKEKERFNKYNALTPVPRSLLPKGSKALTTT